jgi:hypothetical protein
MIDQQDQDVYDELSPAFAGVRLDRDVSNVIRRGRTLRRRWKTMPALAAAGVLAFSLSLAAVTTPSHSPTRGVLVNVDEAGFSVHTDAQTGTVTVALRQLFDEAQLKAILAEAGVHTVFHTAASSRASFMPPCTWTGVHQSDANDVVGPPHVVDNEAVLTIYPSKMPAGSVLGFSLYTLTGSNGKVNGMMVTPTLLSGEPTGCVIQPSPRTNASSSAT